MRQPSITHRVRRFTGIALATAGLAALTIVRHDWLEIVFSIEPDHGSGWFEAGVTLVAAAIAVIAGLIAFAELVRTGRAAHQRLDDPSGTRGG